VPDIVICMRARDWTPADAYARISDFACYPELTEAVREVVVHPPDPDGSVVSEWTVRFRNGLLRWTERDSFDPAALSIVFCQLAGDFASFDGSWRFAPDGPGCRVTFAARFDLGIPTLAEILDPVASAALRTNIVLILRGLLGEVVPVGPPELVGVTRDRAG
jgi:ribosome-associated toxin RatA of RatAB toxin-antitoxin module